MDRKPTKIRTVDPVKLEKDIERYRQEIIKLGATDARIVSTSEIPVDERVVLKCQVPRCFGYGVGANCPPNTLKPAELQSLLGRYSKAVFFIKEVPSHVIVRDKTTIKEHVAAYLDVSKLVGEIESMAFYDGYYLAFGLSAGSCRHTFCSREKDCQAMKGEKCRHSLRARPSMEAVGIDVFSMATSVGWDIYPIGSCAKPDDVPKGILAGMVVIN